MNLTNNTSRKHKQAQQPKNPALLCRHLSFSCFRSLITFNGILESVSKFESATCNFFRFYETYFYLNIKILRRKKMLTTTHNLSAYQIQIIFYSLYN